MSKGHTYASSGVDISAGEDFVKRIKPLVRFTHTDGVLGKYGQFGGFFQLNWQDMRDPVLVSSVDGVGTKLKIAEELGVFHTVGQDLVNHCVDDILVGGARPLFFLDYYATGHLDVERATSIVEGFSTACRENGCALIGGETAEMPGVYQGGDFDLAGTIVGVVERERIIDGSRIRAGDRLIGLPSTGLHTNGYSLVRRLVEETELSWDTALNDGRSFGEAMLEVHKSYLHQVTPLLEEKALRGMSHITGGGIFGNTRRILPDGLDVGLDSDSWRIPEVYQLIQEAGNIEVDEMFRVFNMGIGFILIVSPNDLAVVENHLNTQDTPWYHLGEIIRN